MVFLQAKEQVVHIGHCKLCKGLCNLGVFGGRGDCQNRAAAAGCALACSIHLGNGHNAPFTASVGVQILNGSGHPNAVGDRSYLVILYQRYIVIPAGFVHGNAGIIHFFDQCHCLDSLGSVHLGIAIFVKVEGALLQQHNAEDMVSSGSGHRHHGDTGVCLLHLLAGFDEVVPGQNVVCIDACRVKHILAIEHQTRSGVPGIRKHFAVDHCFAYLNREEVCGVNFLRQIQELVREFAAKFAHLLTFDGDQIRQANAAGQAGGELIIHLLCAHFLAVDDYSGMQFNELLSHIAKIGQCKVPTPNGNFATKLAIGDRRFTLFRFLFSTGTQGQGHNQYQQKRNCLFHFYSFTPQCCYFLVCHRPTVAIFTFSDFYSLTAPPITPAMKCRWNIRNIIIIGRVVRDAPSMMVPKSTDL